MPHPLLCANTFFSHFFFPLFSFTARKTQINHNMDGVPYRQNIIPIQRSCASPWDFSHSQGENTALLPFLPSRCSAQQPACSNICGLETSLPKEPARTLSKLIRFQDTNPALLLSLGFQPTSSALFSLSSSLQRWFCYQHLQVAACLGWTPDAQSGLPCPALPCQPTLPLLTRNLASCPTAVQLNLCNWVVCGLRANPDLIARLVCCLLGKP